MNTPFIATSNKGVPYDGAGSEYQELYHNKAADKDRGWLTNNPEYTKEWYNKIKELVDTLSP